MLLEYKKKMAQRPSENEDESLLFPRFDPFVVNIYPNDTTRGRLLLLPAGRRSQEHFAEFGVKAH